MEGLLDGVAQTPEAQRRYLETIRTKAEDLEHIVSQLFLFSKMELGEMPERLRPLRLDEALRDAVASVREEYEKKGLSIITELEPVTVRADPVQLRRVAANLMENSLKYKQKERGQLHISLQETQEGISLSFADDGPGVPQEALPICLRCFTAVTLQGGIPIGAADWGWPL